MIKCSTIHFLSMFTLASMLVGCVAPPVSIKPELQRRIASVQVVALAPQSNLNIDVAPSNMTTGLIGALVVAALDAKRRGDAEKASVGLQDAVSKLDVRKQFQQTLDADLPLIQSLKIRVPVRLEVTDTEIQREALFRQSTDSAIMFVPLSYQLISGRLIVSSNIQMFPKDPALLSLRPKPNANYVLDAGNAMHSRNYFFSKEAPTPASIQADIVEGINNIVAQFRADLDGVPISSLTKGKVLPIAMLESTGHATKTPGVVPSGVPANAAATGTLTSAAVSGAPAPVVIAPTSAPIVFNDGIARVPYVSDNGQIVYREYLKLPSPKSFAISKTGVWRYAHLHTSTIANRSADPKIRAIENCQEVAKTECLLYAIENEVVFRKGTSEPELAMLKRLENADLVPYMSVKGRENYRVWLTRSLPRAFAVSVTGYSWGSFGPKPLDPSLPEDVVDRALKACERASGGECKVYAIDERVVWAN
jgi:hypothetical protein